LARIDDAPADGAGAGEIVMQHLTIAGADRPLQREELFGEAAEDLQGRILIGQKHIAPHGRITGGNAGKVAKAAAQWACLLRIFLPSLGFIGGFPVIFWPIPRL